jgi:CheY-like chemotaxis protein
MHNTSIYLKRARIASVKRFFPEREAGFNRNGFRKGILIVEDDSDVRVFLRSMLMSEGYHVFEADSEGQALNLWKQHFFRIDLLLTDICIPYVTTGVELARKLQAEKPWLKVIYTTGFSAEIVENDGVSLVEKVNFFCKPYPFGELLDALAKTFKASPRLASN